MLLTTNLTFISKSLFLNVMTVLTETQHTSSPRESILKTAKALVEDTKLLVAGAASSQEKLAQAAQSSAKTITQLTEVVKLGATSMGSEDPETQVTRKACKFASFDIIAHICTLLSVLLPNVMLFGKETQ